MEMWTIILIVLFVAALVFVLQKKVKNVEPPQETYVCDVCGEDVCICRKENIDFQA